MKQLLIFFFLVSLTNLTFAQNYGYQFSKANSSNQKKVLSDELNGSVRSTYSNPIHQESLQKVALLSDLFESYPDLWIEEYTSTEVTVKHNGKVVKEIGKDIKLTAAQRQLCQSADLNSEIIIAVNYRERNTITNKLESGTMRRALIVVPELEAKLEAGDPSQILLNIVKEKLKKAGAQKFEYANVKFTINAQGEVENIKMIDSSTDQKIDGLIIEAIRDMPKWIPASNKKSEKVKQNFEFSVGYYSNC